MAVSEEQIARINFLARKSKAEGLTLAERQEQIELRRAYIQAVKDSLTPLLDSIRVVEVDENGEPIVVQGPGGMEVESVAIETEAVIHPEPAEEPGVLPETGDDTVG